MSTTYPSDLEIARKAKLLPIGQVAARLGIPDDQLVPFGRHKAKVALEAVERAHHGPRGKLVLVSAISPTPQALTWATSAAGSSTPSDAVECRCRSTGEGAFMPGAGQARPCPRGRRS